VPDGQILTKTRLIRAAGLRWPGEEDFEFSKDCAVTAALLKDRTDTQAPLPVRPNQPPPPEPGMIPLTISEIRRLLAALTTRPPPRWHVIHWDTWTCRHQARSR
jgi:hypothetical protein